MTGLANDVFRAMRAIELTSAFETTLLDGDKSAVRFTYSKILDQRSDAAKKVGNPDHTDPIELPLREN